MTTFSSSLKLTLIGDGEQTGVWGNTTNTNLGSLIEQALCYQTSITMTSGNDYTLSTLNGAPDEARSAALIIGGIQAGTNSVICPAKQKVYVITNNLSSGTAYVKPSGGTAIAIPNGKTIVAYCTGTTMQAVDYTATSGTATTATTATNLAGGVQGSVPYQSTTGATVLLSPGTAGKVLTTNGSSNNPTWETIPTPTVATNIANGTAGQIPYQIGANTTGFITAGSAGQILQSTGGGAPIWTALPGSGVISVGATSPLASSGGSTPSISLSGIVPIANGGTGSSTLAGAGLMTLTAVNTLTGATSPGDQRIGVVYGSSGSGMSSESVQVGASGFGIIKTTGFDGSPNIGLIAGSGGAAFQVSSNPALQIYAGAYTCYKGGVSTNWVIYSDSRIKTNITSYTKGLTELKQVQIRNYELNGLGGTVAGTKGVGVIADEIVYVLPESVQTLPTKLHPEDTERVDLKTFDSTELTYLLVNAVKELSAKVDAQAAEIAILKLS